MLELPPPALGSGKKGFPCWTVVIADAGVLVDGEALDAARVFVFGDCPNLKIGLDIWLDSACILAPPPKKFRILASLKGFDVPPTVPKTDMDG